MLNLCAGLPRKTTRTRGSGSFLRRPQPTAPLCFQKGLCAERASRHCGGRGVVQTDERCLERREEWQCGRLRFLTDSLQPATRRPSRIPLSRNTLHIPATFVSECLLDLHCGKKRADGDDWWSLESRFPKNKWTAAKAFFSDSEVVEDA